jgi:hypothetical protein
VSVTEPTNLAEYRMKRRLRRAREWTTLVTSCMYCGDEYAWKDRHDHHCLKDG